MGKTCIAAIGLGLAGAIIGMHIYICFRDLMSIVKLKRNSRMPQRI